jgi:hypothetical protein
VGLIIVIPADEIVRKVKIFCHSEQSEVPERSEDLRSSSKALAGANSRSFAPLRMTIVFDFLTQLLGKEIKEILSGLKWN